MLPLPSEPSPTIDASPDLVAASDTRTLAVAIDGIASEVWTGDVAALYAPAIARVRADPRLRWLRTRGVAMVPGWELSAPGRRVPTEGVPGVRAP